MGRRGMKGRRVGGQDGREGMKGGNGRIDGTVEWAEV